MTLVNFSQHLEALIRQRGITQKQLAADMDVSQATVFKWLNGTMPGGEKLNRLAAYFGLNPDYLLNPAKYDAPIIIARRVADDTPGTKEEKQAAFEHALYELTDRLSEEVDWQARAIEAERQVQLLKDKLAQIRDLVTFPEVSPAPMEKRQPIKYTGSKKST